MPACRSCQAEVVWVVVAASNKRMPLDPAPVPLGNVVRLEADTVRVLTSEERARRVAQPGGPGDLFVSHFSTCPEAANFRKPRTWT